MRNLRSILGNSIATAASVLTIALFALPMLVMTIGDVSVDSGTVYEWMGEVSSNYMADAMKAGIVLFIIALVIACLLALTAIINLVCGLMSKKINLTAIVRALSILLTLFALIALILVSVDLGETGKVGAGAVMPLIMGMFAIVAAFVAPGKKKAK